MTVLVGIVCRDGLVIASDSQESSDYMKRLDVRKIFDSTQENDDLDVVDAELIIAGAGTSAYISRFVEEFNKQIYEPDFIWPRNVADAAEDAMRAMHERYGRDLNMGVLLGAWCRNAPRDDEHRSPYELYTVHVPGVAANVTDYAAMGSGEPFASYLLHRLHGSEHPTTELSIEAAINESIYVVEETKKVQLHCGGPTQVAYIRDGKVARKTQEEIHRISLGLEIADQQIKGRQREVLITAVPPTA